MAALVPGRSRLRQARRAASTDSEDSVGALLSGLRIDSPPAVRGPRVPRARHVAMAANTPASVRRGGLDGDAWSRVSRADGASPAPDGGDDEDDGEPDDEEFEGWLASEEDVSAAGSGDSDFVEESVASEEEGDADADADEGSSVDSDASSVVDLTTPEKRSTPLVDLTNSTPRDADKKRVKKTKKSPGRLPRPDLSARTPAKDAKSFARRRAKLLEALFAEYDETVCGGALGAAAVGAVWSKRLRTTSGLTRMSRRREVEGGEFVRKASVELSTHVCDSEEKLRNTLSHELCHAAAWIVDGVSKPPHGRAFKTWARAFMAKHPDLYITTRHAYVINYKFNWKCTATGCDYRIGRHSKSLDVARFVCPKCAAPLAACAAPGA